jgi:hypothetical protein
MSKWVIRTIIGMMVVFMLHAPHAVWAQQLSSDTITTIQQEFGGRVVGVSPTPEGGEIVEVQILSADGTVLIIMVDALTGEVRGVRQ